MNSKDRIEYIDIFKGISIILIVIGHLSVGSTIKNFIYSFHVPLFLFASGIVYKKRTSLVDFLKRDFLRILYGYIFFTAVWMLFEYVWTLTVLGQHSNYSIFQYFATILVGNGNITGISIGVQWYLSMYLAIRVIYEIESLIRNGYIRFLVVIMIYGIGGFALNGNAFLPWCLSSALTGLVFFYLGSTLSQMILKLSYVYKKQKRYRVMIPIVSYGIILLVGGVNSMSRNSYDSPILFLLSSVIGILGTLTLSIEIESLNIECFKKVLLYYGRNSLYVMGWHSELRVVFIYLLGSVIRSGLLKNIATLGLTLVVCIPLCFLTNILFHPSSKKLTRSSSS